MFKVNNNVNYLYVNIFFSVSNITKDSDKLLVTNGNKTDAVTPSNPRPPYIHKAQHD